jgi:hypothetical protein
MWDNGRLVSGAESLSYEQGEPVGGWKSGQNWPAKEDAPEANVADVPPDFPIRIVNTLVARFTDIFKEQCEFQWCYRVIHQNNRDYEILLIPDYTTLQKTKYSVDD